MANKKLIVEIDADTGKYVAKLKELPSLIAKQTEATAQLKTLDELRLKILNDNKQSLTDARASIAATAEKAKNLNDAFKLGAMNATLVSVNRNLSEMSEQLSKIAIKQKELNAIRQAQNFASTLGTVSTDEAYNKRTGPYRESNQFGTVAEKRQAESLAKIKSYEDAVAAVQASITRKEKEELTKQEFAIKSSYNSRYQMYAEMFDKIAEKQARTSFASLGQNVYKPKSDFGISLTTGLTKASRDSELQKEEETHRKLEEVAKKRKASLEELARTHRSLAESVIYSTLIYKTFTFTLHQVGNAITSIPKVGIELEATRASLTATTGSTAGMYSALEALNAEADRTGISIAGLRENFRTFQASTSLAGESLQDTWEMFTNINTVSTALHLNTEKTIGIFNALAQIFNKSKVQSEELVKQLGNLLPGAFASFQKANSDMFKSTQDLIAQMQKGAVFAHDTVKNFTEFLATRFGAAFALASQGLNANIGRLQTSFTLLQESIYNTSSGPINAFVKGLTSLLNITREYVEEGNKLNQFIATVAGSLGGLLTATLINKVIPAIKLATASTIDFKTTLISLGSTAVLASLTALETRLYAIGQAQAEVYSRGKELAEEYTAAQTKANKALPIEIRIEADKEIKQARNEIEKTKKEFEDIRKSKLAGGNVRKTDEGLLPLAEAESKIVESITVQERLLQKAIEAKGLEIKKADQDALNNIVTGGVNLSEAIEQVHIDALKAQGKNIEAAGAQWDKTYKDKVQSAKTSIERANEQLKSVTDADIRTNLQAQIETNTKFIAEAAQARQKALDDAETKDAKKASSAARKEANALSKTETKDIALELEKQQTLYNQNIISFVDYYNKRAAVISEGIATEQGLNRGEEGKQKILEYKRQQEQLEQDRFSAAISDMQQKRSLEEEYYTTIGDYEKALKIQLEDKYSLIINRLKEQQELGNANAAIELDRITLLQTEALAQAKVTNAAKDFNKIIDFTAARETQIFQQQQQGFITSEKALKQLSELRSENIAKAYEELQIIEKQAEASVDYTKKLEALQARQKYEATFGAKSSVYDRAISSNMQNPGTDIAGLFKAHSETQTGLSAEKDANLLDLTLKRQTGEIASFESFQQKKQEIEEKYATASMATQTGLYAGIAGVAANSFESIYQNMAKMYGAQSKEAKKAFAAYKAAKLAEVTIASVQSVMNSYAAGASMGYAAPVMAPLLAGIAAAFGAVQIAQVASMQPPAAHGGLTEVPKEQTYLLDKGERVLSPRQNKDLTSYLKSNKQTDKQTQAATPNSNVKIVNVLDPGVFNNYFQSNEGEQMIMNVVRRNNISYA